MHEKIKREYTNKEARLLHIEKWRQSGLSMSAYSREANISMSNLSKWVQSENKSKTKFKPITLSSSAPMIKQGNMIEIIVDNRIRIQLPNLTDPSIAINIIRGLTQCS